MNIIISRDDQSFGPYSKDQAMKFLESGELLSSDLASWEGNEDWVPLESLLSSSPVTEETEDPVEDDSLDDFDHEKMKQWEDVFVDDEDDIPSEGDQFIDDDYPDDEVPEPELASVSEEPVQSAPPLISGTPSPPEILPVQDEQTSDPLPPVSDYPDTEVEQEALGELASLPPPPPPPPPPPSSKSKKKSPRKANPESSSSQSLTPRSKKIKGLNSRQTVIVVKGQSIFSKIYTSALILLILIVVIYLAAFVCLIKDYEWASSFLSKAPLLFPESLIETFEPKKEPSNIVRQEKGLVLFSGSLVGPDRQGIKFSRG